MNFNEHIDAYIELLHCTSKELADASGLSATVISRYRRGERNPNANSEMV